MDLIYICTVVFAIASMIIIVPIAYRAGRAKQKATDISELPMIAGTILIETSDPDGPYLFLDLEKPVDVIGSQKHVICKISTNGKTSEE